MSKIKEKDGVNKIFYLEKETILDIKQDAATQGLSESCYIDWLMTEKRLQKNPIELLQHLRTKKEGILNKINELQNDVKTLEIKEKSAMEYAEKISKWQSDKLSKKTQGVKLITTNILNKDFESAERLAKVWSRITTIPPQELILEAMDKAKKGI